MTASGSHLLVEALRSPLRVWHERLFRGLVIAGAALLLGNSGAGLAVLWAALPARPLGREPAWETLLAPGVLAFAHVAPHRVVLVGRSMGRTVVYRDEVAPADWARLRRFCLGNGFCAGQPATGRSTSSWSV